MTDIEFGVGEGVKTSHSKLFEYLKRIFNFKNLFTTHNSQFTKAIAFTLAETLIVMGIIGVVAALTLPNLNSSTGDREKVAKVKKIYQNLNDIHGRLESVYGPVKEWNCNQYTNFITCYLERLTDFTKITKTCKTRDDCNAIGFSTGDNGWFAYLFSDGMSLMGGSDSTCKCSCHQAGYDNVCGTLQVNINGKKGLFTEGKDIFRFAITTEGIFPCDRTPERCLLYSGGDVECTSWVINFGNMDYLKIDNSKKCKNSSIVLDGVSNTTCK